MHRNSSNQRLSLAEKRSYINGLKAHARLLLPESQGRLTASLDRMLLGLDDSSDEKRAAITAGLKQYGELIEAAANGNAEARAGLARMRIEKVNNFLEAKSNVMSFFRPVTLQPDEMPVFENTSRQEILVHYIGQDGGYRRTQPIKSHDSQMFDLHFIATEEYEYPLWDLRTGVVADDAKANIDMADDLDRAIDTKLWPFLQKQVGAFQLTGSKALRTYVAHSSVNKKNLPTTNLLTIPGNSTTTLWRKECMDAVIQYCMSWGNSLPGGQVKPVEIFIPSSEMTGFLSQITLTSQGNTLVEQIMEDGWVQHYAGMDWVLRADETLDPDAGRAYARTNQAVGNFYTKPSLDKTWDDLSIANQKQNKGVLSMQKPIGMAIPAAWSPYIIGIQYHTAR